MARPTGRARWKLGAASTVVIAAVAAGLSMASREAEAHGATQVPASEARLDARDSPPFATIYVGDTGGAASYVTLDEPTSAAIGGVHAVYVTVRSSHAGDAVAVDWFRFQP